MPGLELPIEDVERLRLTEPLTCPRCYDERARPNYRLCIVDRGAGARQITIIVRCSAGHLSRAVFVPLDGMVFHDVIPLHLPGSDGITS